MDHDNLTSTVTAYVEVFGADGYRYWNPIFGTEANTADECQILLDRWIEATAPTRHMTPEVYRATRRFQLDLTPIHARGKYRGDPRPVYANSWPDHR